MKKHSILPGFILLVVAGLFPAAPVSAQEPVGSAVVVVNLVTAAFNRDTRSLIDGDEVRQNELIEVGLDARSEIELEDNTKLALGSGSRLMLDKFVYDPDKKKNGSIVLDLVKGTFRFVTGVAEKPTYLIKTPSAAITVRGTIFDIYVEDSGLAWLLLHEGAVRVCNLRGECHDLDEPGKLIRIGDDGAVGDPVRWASLEDNGRVPFDDAFPFVSEEPEFESDPVLTRDVIMLGALIPPPKKSGIDRKKADKTPARASKPKKSKKRAATTPTKRKKKKQRAEKSGPSGSDLFGTAVGIGIGIGIGKIGGGGRKGGGGHHRGGGSYR